MNQILDKNGQPIARKITVVGQGDYGKFGRGFDDSVKTFQPIKTWIRESRKIGRNEPCPCGSGLKYKKCHGGL